MFTTLRNAWKITELRKKILFTLLIILIYRLGNVVPVPFVNVNNMSAMFKNELSGTIFGLFNMMSGNAFSMATIFALGIQPYINASIIVQLLTIAIPALERLSKEGGEEGKKTIEKITRYSTVGLGLLMGVAYYIMLTTYNKEYSAQGMNLLSDTGFFQAAVIVLSFTAGASLVMWLGEQITAYGIGNGISMILFANIIARIPGTIILPLWNMCFPTESTVSSTWYWAILLLVSTLAVIVFIIFVTQAERRIPVQYAKRVVGRKVYGGQSSHLPIKVNMSGVMPIIFAQSIASLPATIAAFCGVNDSNGGWWYKNVFSSTSAIYTIVYLVLIVGFSYFYATIQYNPVEVANNLKKNGGFIPGFRPGRPTSDFIRKVIGKITLFGAIFLGVIAVLPVLLGAIVGDTQFSFGGTSIIIVVSVALETVSAIEAQMMMRNYSGFLD
ncbi:MAG: preprotein translocase subunit SecY [Oscillospiraceae bacterium]|nr:preprotein translocase subunit SecY [Oscillospiraceae bacterium]